MKTKTYGEIWNTFRDRFVREQIPEETLRRIHVKWKILGKTT